ncbi:MAG: hypothetical protein A3J06_01200 [Candidatus Moranbacteria bacterium RIFCSPLOWO2_02_FULL_48_19]|nr:MAG: hypothetical protein A3J06_01200 [Candidatus Moranbacteria bacterium RIFCSPLOWO2_02_FULL_48_19]OGI32012.1 MAG: hypothetical protein A3G09_03020 [Candidatus Moranbacteria bacterium RIFCSPLOWO2_12_FULL_48_12]
MEKQPINSFDELEKKLAAFKEKHGADLSSGEDLSLAVMNLISLEEHFFMSAMKTEKGEYLDCMEEVRETRKIMLQKLMPDNEGESWCISKHLLAASMRLIEVGTKYRSAGKKAEAQEFFERAYKLYSLFWAVKLKLVNVGEKTKKDKTFFGKIEDIVMKLVDCCKE